VIADHLASPSPCGNSSVHETVDYANEWFIRSAHMLSLAKYDHCHAGVASNAQT